MHCGLILSYSLHDILPVFAMGLRIEGLHIHYGGPEAIHLPDKSRSGSGCQEGSAAFHNTLVELNLPDTLAKSDQSKELDVLEGLCRSTAFLAGLAVGPEGMAHLHDEVTHVVLESGAGQRGRGIVVS